MSTESDSPLLAHIKNILDESEQQLTPETLRRLQQARVLATQHQPATPWWVNATSIGVTAGIGLLAVNLWLNHPLPRSNLPFEDVELLSGEQNLEFYRELEFYQWLEDEKQQS